MCLSLSLLISGSCCYVIGYLHIFKIFIFVYLFGFAGFSLQHVGTLVVACGILLPDQGLNLAPLHWECGFVATGPPGKSLGYLHINNHYGLITFYDL